MSVINTADERRLFEETTPDEWHSDWSPSHVLVVGKTSPDGTDNVALLVREGHSAQNRANAYWTAHAHNIWIEMLDTIDANARLSVELAETREQLALSHVEIGDLTIALDEAQHPWRTFWRWLVAVIYGWFLR